MPESFFNVVLVWEGGAGTGGVIGHTEYGVERGVQPKRGKEKDTQPQMKNVKYEHPKIKSQKSFLFPPPTVKGSKGFFSGSHNSKHNSKSI